MIDIARKVNMASCCRGERMDDAKSTPFYPNWMADLPENLHTKPLNTLAIPGSHDSFSAFLDPKGGTAPNCPGVAKELEKIFGSTAANIIYKWSITQDGGFYRQLIAGIRYLDLRIAANKNKDNDLYFCHGLYAQSVGDGLLDVKQFIEEHPKEVVFLDMNHFYSLDESKHQELVALMQKMFGDRLCPPQPMSGVTLSNLWKNKQQVLVFYHDEKTVKEFPFLWKGATMLSPWGNTDDVGKLIHLLTANFMKPRDNHIFYVTQGVLTPTAAYILKHLFGGLHKDISDLIVQPFLHWLLQKYSGPNGINICILDYCIDNDFISTVLDLNKNYREDN